MPRTLKPMIERFWVNIEVKSVDEDDCLYRTIDDNSEIAHEWNLIRYLPLPSIPQGEDNE